MTDGLHHFHKRKRIHERHEPYPHPERLKRFVDGLIYAGGVLGPLATIPQFVKIWIEKNAAGVSALSWTGYFIGSVFWLLYGIVHREKPIIFVYVVWICLNLLIVIGVLLYG